MRDYPPTRSGPNAGRKCRCRVVYVHRGTGQKFTIREPFDRTGLRRFKLRLETCNRCKEKR